MFNIQYSFISKQYTDSSNAREGNLSGIIGQIPQYQLLDISLSYLIRKFRFETGDRYSSDLIFEYLKDDSAAPGHVNESNLDD